MYLSTPIAILLLFFFPFSIFAAEKIDVNIAPIEDLIEICHIGEARAKELIFLRPFSSIDNLTRIKGISRARVEDIKKQGLAWVSIQEKSKSEPEPQTAGVASLWSPPVYPTGIVINEILPSPKGPDSENEWIELFNQNNFEVDISKWKLADIKGSVKTYIFPEGVKIKRQGFLVLPRPATKIILNNKSDGLKLFQPDGIIADEVMFEKAPKGKSYNRTESGWQWSNVLTSDSINIIPEPQTQKVDRDPVSDKYPQELINNHNPETPKILAMASKTTQSLTTPSIAFVLAVFSGLIIFFLKKNLKTN